MKIVSDMDIESKSKISAPNRESNCIFLQKNENIKTKKATLPVALIYGTPKRIRIAVYTVKGCCPRPLDDGGLTDNIYTTKSICIVKQSVF